MVVPGSERLDRIWSCASRLKARVVTSWRGAELERFVQVKLSRRVLCKFVACAVRRGIFDF